MDKKTIKSKKSKEGKSDFFIYKKALREFKKNPVTYSHEEVCKLLGIKNK
ncbi:hypothetical protein [Ezakiella peruensis]|nr:hypothetical protein [Ezakiella peruensis]